MTPRDLSPPPGVLTERQLFAAFPGLTLKAVKRGQIAGTFPRPEKLPGGGHAWREAAVRKALAARDVPDAPRAVPAGHVGIAALVGVPRVSRCMARRAGAPGKQGHVTSAPQRQARPGLVPLTEAQIRAAITAGTFPAPATGPGVECWPLAAVTAWLKRNRPGRA